MILKAPKIISHPKPSHIPIIKEWIPKPLKASCGCGEIKSNEEAYIESKATGGAYCDMVCLCQSEGIEYTPERREYLKDKYEVISYG